MWSKNRLSDLGPDCFAQRLLKHFSRLERQTTFVGIGALRVKLFRKARHLVFWVCSHLHYVRAAMALVRLHKSIIWSSQSPLEDYAISTISYVLADTLIYMFKYVSRPGADP